MLELASFLYYVQENPFIMQMALVVTIEGHLLCAPWAAAERRAFLQGPFQTQPEPHRPSPQLSAHSFQPCFPVL